MIVKLLCKIPRIKNLFLIFSSLLCRRAKIKGDPIILMMEPSSRCNLECPMCPRQLKQTNRKEGEMSFDNFKKIIDELSDTLMFLALWNYGEPLLNDKLAEMTKYAKQKGIGVVLSTNAVLLTPQKSSELIDAGVDLFIIPLDGATKSIYERYRKNAIFERTLDNIRFLLAERRRRKRSTPLVDLQFLMMRNNEHEISIFRDLAKTLAVDLITFKKVGYVKGREKEFLPKDRNLISSYYIRGVNADYCNRLSLSSVIDSDGDVVPCCSDLTSKYVFGNVFNGKGFREVWNNEAYQAFRKRAYKGIGRIDICQNCACANFDSGVYL